MQKTCFAYTNHMFTPGRDKIGYRVILRLQGKPIQGDIVVCETFISMSYDPALRTCADALQTGQL